MRKKTKFAALSSSVKQQIFDLQPLEIRRLLTTASIVANNTLSVIGTSSSETITINKNSSGKITVSGVTATFTIGSSTNQINKILIEASGGNDTILITNNVRNASNVGIPVTLAGGTGNDTITSGPGNDVLSGNDGNDLMDPGVGNDLITGGAGFDTSNYSTRTSPLFITMGSGANDGEISIGEADDVQTEEVLGGSAADTIVGSNLADYIGGGGGGDSMSGGDGNDQITGSSGIDKYFGQNGNDFLVAQNSDADTVNGGTNSDGTGDTDLASIDVIDVSGAAAKGGPDTTPGGLGSALDNTFDNDGKAVGPDTLGFFPVATAVDSLGRIYFAGSDFRQNPDGFFGEDMVIVRMTASGQFDTTFGDGGLAYVDFTAHNGSGYGYNDDDQVGGLAIDDDDNIIVVGSTSPSFGDQDIAIARFTPAGALDSGFGYGNDGLATVDYFGYYETANAVAVQADGKIVVVGTAFGEGQFGLAARLTDTGLLDGSFNDGVGRAALPLDEATAVAFQSFSADEGAQRIVIGGIIYNDNADFALTRLDSQGFGDGDFGSEGLVVTDFGASDYINDIAVNSLNQIVAVGNSDNFIIGIGPEQAVNEQNGILAVYSPDAQGAPSFVDQPPTVEPEFGSVSFNGVAIDGQNRIIVAGSEAGDFLTARYLPNLTLDTGFAPGLVHTDLSADETFNQFDVGLDAFVLANGKIIVAGRTDQPNESNTIAAVRFSGANGAPPNMEAEVTEVEGFVDYDELHDPNVGPPVKTYLDNSSETARLYTLSQLDENGFADIPLDSRNDVVTVYMVAGAGEPTVAVNINGVVLFYAVAGTNRIVIHGGFGNDSITSAADVPVQLVLDGAWDNDTLIGGAGNDVIQGGGGDDNLNGQGGNDAIAGGDGRDSIAGGPGFNLLIGGRGFDTVTGNTGEDILIGGFTAHDENAVALGAITTVWSNTGFTRTQRINFIRNGGGPNGALLRTGFAATVFDDAAGDTLTGAGGLDWFFFRNTNPNKDKVDSTAGEEVNFV